jgi:hypothetical protein
MFWFFDLFLWGPGYWPVLNLAVTDLALHIDVAQYADNPFD